MDFLQKNGHTIDSNPNTRINDEQHALLVKEFGKNLSPQERERMLSKPVAEEVVAPEKKEKEEKVIEEIKIEIPEEFKPKFITKGKIELDKPKQTEKAPVEKEKIPEKQETRTESVNEMPAQPAEQKPPQEETLPVEKKVVMEKEKAPQIIKEKEAEQEKKITEAEEKGKQPDETKAENKTPFRLNISKPGPNIKVTGKIDLSSINQSHAQRKKQRKKRRKNAKKNAKKPQ